LINFLSLVENQPPDAITAPVRPPLSRCRTLHGGTHGSPYDRGLSQGDRLMNSLSLVENQPDTIAASARLAAEPLPHASRWNTWFAVP
jgi:hypothetical protein